MPEEERPGSGDVDGSPPGEGGEDRTAGELSDPSGPPARTGGDVALAAADLRDIEGRLRKADAEYRRHVMWLVMGVSPAALIPLLYAISELGASAVVAVIGVAIVVESWKAIGSRREMRRLEIAAAEARGRLEEAEGADALTAPPSD